MYNTVFGLLNYSILLGLQSYDNLPSFSGKCPFGLKPMFIIAFIDKTLRKL